MLLLYTHAARGREDEWTAGMGLRRSLRKNSGVKGTPHSFRTTSTPQEPDDELGRYRE